MNMSTGCLTRLSDSVESSTTILTHSVQKKSGLNTNCMIKLDLAKLPSNHMFLDRFIYAN